MTETPDPAARTCCRCGEPVGHDFLEIFVCHGCAARLITLEDARERRRILARDARRQARRAAHTS